ncbi:hypothetical protein [Lichenibacterium dinghuense]|uniref:hypothetical protein n=1 Tax=Lichenibacterium dinghuense TaxID=2895977 RepID=UPI001F23D4D0|nr:hypothetical protein [Lichenibacterium sp. 6Y81]
MPILACHGGPYPFDAPEFLASIRLDRAGNRCEHCGRPHGREVLCFGEDLWWDEDALAWLPSDTSPTGSGTAAPPTRSTTGRPSASSSKGSGTPA